MVAVARFGLQAGPAQWVSVGDPVMGGQSTGAVEPLDAKSSVFRGEVSLANGGGFASVKCDVPTLDLSGHDGVVLDVRGDGKEYKLGLRMTWDRNAPVYQHAFATTADCREPIMLPFAGFVPSFRGRTLPDAPALDPARIASLSLFISGKQAGPFALVLYGIDACPPSGT